MGKCTYEFMAGKKKNTLCNRFIRKKDETLCWVHRPKNIESAIEVEKSENIPIKKEVIIKKKFEKTVEKSPVK